MKRTPLKRGTSQLKRTPIGRNTPFRVKAVSKKPKTALRRSKTQKRSKSPSIKTLRNKTDKLLTPLIKQMYPNCLLCSKETQVAHHHIHKSTSSRLRYEVDNLIPLCHHCHCALHHNESFWASKIIQIKGIEWFNKLEKMKGELVKINKEFYKENYERLEEIKKNIGAE